MIAKTTIGADFLGAICYGAGLRVNGKEIEGKSELLLTHNLVSDDPKGMAREMQREAEFSRCKKPVWHTSLSWKPGKNPTKEQMIEAANRYCEKMGANPEDHQIVVFQHHDRPHMHVHVYINRLPIGGGKALETSHNYAKNTRICKEISHELGFSLIDKVPAHSLRFVQKAKQEAQQTVHLAIKQALKLNCKTHEQFIEMLKSMGVQSKFTLVDGRLKYSSYNCRGVNVKGQDVGFSAKRLQLILDKSKAKEAQSQTKQNRIKRHI